MLTYNLFRHKSEADLYCAVPEDRPVPTFLTRDAWAYACSLDTIVIPGFDATAGRTDKDNGFILFHQKQQSTVDGSKLGSLD